MELIEHPGTTIYRNYLHSKKLTIVQLAKAINISRPYLNNIISGRRPISLEISIRLSKALGTSPRYWIDKQIDYDLNKLQTSLKDELDVIIPLCE